MVLPVPILSNTLGVWALVLDHDMARHHNSLLSRQYVLLALIITRWQGRGFGIGRFAAAQVWSVGARMSACAGVVLLCVAAAWGECTRSGGVYFVKCFDEDGSDCWDAWYNKDDPHLSSMFGQQILTNARPRLRWDSRSPYIQTCEFKGDVWSCCQSTELFGLDSRTSCSTTKLSASCSTHRSRNAYTTPKPNNTIRPILTWSCSFKLQKMKMGYKASATSRTAPKPW